MRTGHEMKFYLWSAKIRKWGSVLSDQQSWIKNNQPFANLKGWELKRSLIIRTKNFSFNIVVGKKHETELRIKNKIVTFLSLKVTVNLIQPNWKKVRIGGELFLS